MSPETPSTTGGGSRALTDALDLSFRLLRVALGLLLVAYLLSGVFIVHQHEKAFVLLFGRPVGGIAPRLYDPGPHWTFPRPFAEIAKLQTGRVRTIETTGLPRRSPQAPPGTPLPPAPWDRLLLTGDANLLSAGWALRYTVSDPYRYLFAYRQPDAVLRNELDHAIVKVSARFAVDAALRTDVESYREAVDRELRERLGPRGLDLGVNIERVDVLGLLPPGQVAAAFDDVVQAEQERSSAISEARAYAARLTSETQGEAARQLAEARAAKEGLLASTGADAAYFSRILPKYRDNPDVTVRTLRQDAFRRALGQVGQVYFVRRGPDGRQELRLWLSPRARPLVLPGNGSGKD